MMRLNRQTLSLLALAVLASGGGWPLAAQDAPELRVATLSSETGAALRIPVSGESVQLILFDTGELIETVWVNHPEAYAPSVVGSRDSLRLETPAAPVQAVLTVQTDRRSYRFDLVPAVAGEAPTIVHVAEPQFSHTGSTQQLTAQAGGDETGETPSPPPQVGRYKLGGAKELHPTAISDDGFKTYLQWAEEQPMPAVFGIGPAGKEEMVEGYMRGGYFTIDRVYAELVFRIDEKKATSRRVAAERGK